MKAPYKPTIRYPEDISNFDPVVPEKVRNHSNSSNDSWECGPRGRPQNGLENGKHPEHGHAFFEFTFRRFFDDGGHPYPVPVDVDMQSDLETDVGSNSEPRAREDSHDSQEPVYV